MKIYVYYTNVRCRDWEKGLPKYVEVQRPLERLKNPSDI